MIHLTPLRDLTLNAPPSVGRAAFLSAASGLVEIGQYLYVVADDELQLGVFPAQGNAHGNLLRLRAGELPDSYKQRKAHKPDFEVLVRLPPFAGFPGGALLAMGSGSTTNRNTGALLSLAADGRAFGMPRSIDLSGVYGPLAPRFHTLNIEGAVVVGDTFVLMQRGNKHDAQSAYVHLRLPDVLAALASTNSLGAAVPTKIRS